MNTSPNRCIFCGNGKLSKEHFWPTWLHKYLPVPAVNDSHSYKLMESGVEMDIGKRPGHLKTKKIRKVCKTCNNGWMSKLESSMKPALTKLLEGSTCTLQEEEILAISQWVTLKIIVAEHARNGYIVTSDKERESFKSELKIPSNFNIFLGKFDTGIGGTEYVRQCNRISLTPFLSLDEGYQNIQVITFSIGEIIFHIRHSTVMSFDFNVYAPPPNSLIQLYPNAICASWPPNITLSDRQAGHLANSLDKILGNDC